MLGASLTRPTPGKAPADRLALEPYWGKPTVRNLRGGGGDVGIIRSPVRATALPDQVAPVPDDASTVPALGAKVGSLTSEAAGDFHG